jgi:hypothetical protein
MKRLVCTRSECRLVLIILLSLVGLVIVLLWRPGQSPAWAAPGQNPYFQTVPTRPPTETAGPTSTVEVTQPAPQPTQPALEPTDSSPGDDDEDDGDSTPAATPGEPIPSLTPASLQEPISPVPTPSQMSSPTATAPPLNAATSTPASAPAGSTPDASRPSSPATRSSSTTFPSPTTAPRSTPTATSVPLIATLATPASPARFSMDEPLEGAASDDESPVWLYALAFGLVLIALGFVFSLRARGSRNR